MKKTLFSMLCLAFGAGLGFSVDTEKQSSEETITLKSDLKTGKRYVYVMSMNQEMTTTISGEKMDQKMEMAMEYSSDVTAAEGGKKKMVTEYKEASLEMDMSYGGEKLDMGDANDSMASLVGKKFTVILGEGDLAEKVIGLDEMLADDDPATAQIMKQILNEDSLKQMINQGTLAAFPDKPIAVGDSWKFSVDLPLGSMGKGKMTGKYTYMGKKEKDDALCAKIKMNASIEMNFGSTDVAEGDEAQQVAEMMDSLDMKIDGSKVSGDVFFDEEIGTVRASDMKMMFKMSMKNPGTDERILMPMNQKMKVTLKGIEDLKEAE